MTPTPPPSIDARSLRVFHLLLTAGTGMMALVLVGIRLGGLGSEVAPVVATLLGAAGFAMAGGSLALRTRFGPSRRHETIDEWWATNRRAQQALVMWAIAAGGVDFGAVAYFLSGQTAAAAPGIMVGLLAMAWSTPGRLERA